MKEKRVKKHSKSTSYMIILCVAALIVIMALICFIVSCVNGGNNAENGSAVSSLVSSVESVSSAAVTSAENSSSKPSVDSTVSTVNSDTNLDPTFEKLLLVNGWNPLPDDYNYSSNLTTIPAKYHNGQLDQIDKDIWPYMKAMLEAAWEDGVDLKVWSPYRSYDTQNMLYQNQVQREINKGLSRSEAEDEAATVVARPGTSEHNSGLAADFNMASDAFENTEMYTWMKANAENYGFIMRYSAEKQPITGVIHESWHWRFVGINHAKKINDLGMCLEEYVDYLNNSQSDSN